MPATLWKQFNDGGWGMWPIVVCFSWVVQIAVERVWLVVRSSWGARRFRRSLRRCLLGRDINGALALCDTHRTPVARAVRAGLVVARESDARIQLAIDAAVLAEVPGLWKRTPLLVALGNFGVWLGLLGTLTGLVRGTTSCSGESVDPSQKARILAEGISEAMNCTAFGLLTAVAAVAAYGVLRCTTEAVERNLREVVLETMSLVSAHRAKLFPAAECVSAELALGHRRAAGEIRLEGGADKRPEVSIILSWGDDILATDGWRLRRNRAATLEIREPGGAPLSRLKLDWDGQALVRWRFEQAPCPPGCAFGVRVEACDAPRFGRGQTWFETYSRAAAMGFPGPWRFRPRAIGAAVLTLTVHAATLGLAAYRHAALEIESPDERDPRSTPYLLLQDTSAPTPLALVRIVQTPISPDAPADKCPESVDNCQFSSGMLGLLQFDHDAARPLFQHEAARRGKKHTPGNAFRNWIHREGGQLGVGGMARRHVVRRGESLRSIAERYGLADWQCIYDADINPDLVETRPDPDRIWVGDEIYVPYACVDEKPYGPLR
jgi:biopolymer transport protein ExbB